MELKRFNLWSSWSCCEASPWHHFTPFLWSERGKTGKNSPQGLSVGLSFIKPAQAPLWPFLWPLSPLGLFLPQLLSLSVAQTVTNPQRLPPSVSKGKDIRQARGESGKQFTFLSELLIRLRSFGQRIAFLMVFVQHHLAGDQNSVTLCSQLALVNKNVVFSGLNAHVHPPAAAAHCSSGKGRGKVAFLLWDWDFPQSCYSRGAYSTCVSTKCCNSETQAGPELGLSSSLLWRHSMKKEMWKVLGLPTAVFRGFSYPERGRKPWKVQKVPIQV